MSAPVEEVKEITPEEFDVQRRELEAAVAAAGAQVRKLKEEGADGDVLGAAVTELRKCKEALKQAVSKQLVQTCYVCLAQRSSALCFAHTHAHAQRARIGSAGLRRDTSRDAFARDWLARVCQCFVRRRCRCYCGFRRTVVLALTRNTPRSLCRSKRTRSSLLAKSSR